MPRDDGKQQKTSEDSGRWRGTTGDNWGQWGTAGEGGGWTDCPVANTSYKASVKELKPREKGKRLFLCSRVVLNNGCDVPAIDINACDRSMVVVVQ